jgi:hypothetical protein
MGWLSVGKQFIKPFTKTGAKTISDWKSGAAKAKGDAARFGVKEKLYKLGKKWDKQNQEINKKTEKIKKQTEALLKKRK